LRHLVTELEVDAVEEAAFGGIGGDEQAAKLGAVGEEFAGAGDCKRQIEAALPPVGDALGKLGRALEAMIRREAAREFRGRLPYASKIEVLLVGPLPDLGDVGVVRVVTIKTTAAPAAISPAVQRHSFKSPCIPT
jgi:hypothetical protein